VASAELLPGNLTYPIGSTPGTLTTGAFVLEGYGLWPMAVFTNQALLVGPVSDPAHVRGLASASRAVRQIADRGHKFLVAALDVRIYFLDELLIAASGAKLGDWVVRSTSLGTALLEQAASLGAYTVWGDETISLKAVTGKLEPLVTADPVMQRTMVSIIVNPHAVSGVNAPGARSFQEYLTTPAAQAAVLGFREKGFSSPTFWPAAATSA
jgi:tungstate transport system substrate-binding protein